MPNILEFVFKNRSLIQNLRTHQNKLHKNKFYSVVFEFNCIYSLNETVVVMPWSDRFNGLLSEVLCDECTMKQNHLNMQ